ncbi:MAG: hypothetical protein WC583_02735 [Candidatus Omnitrophota bacterium]|jgi:hypothetical protein|nr:hypothetical protein [Sphaerochaeta sp.]
MKTLTIETAAGLYKPLELLIDGVTFRVKTMTLDALESVQGLQSEAAAGSAAAIKKMLGLVLEGPLEMVGKLTIDKIFDIVEFAVKETTKPEAESKNAPGPGLPS